jgi:stage IV sporulation protein B
MTQGRVYNASVLTVRTGKVGAPGQLMSSVTGGDVIGSLRKNTPQGVFGTADMQVAEEKLPVGTKEDVRCGAATIRSTVAGCTVREYSVEIVKIYPNSGPSGRNMLIRITDPALLAATGGIVQGMSGSPIIQDGKLIGAVTHVLVNDPTTGYGIFIENMLDAAA